MENEGTGFAIGRGTAGLLAWVDDCARLCKPDWIHWCDGSAEEDEGMVEQMLITGELIPLNQMSHPNCYLHRTPPSAQDKDRTTLFTCSQTSAEAGAMNTWQAPESAKDQMAHLLAGSMRGRTMYIVPHVMGPIESPLARTGVIVTDNPFVAASLRILTHVGEDALQAIGRGDRFIAGLHVRRDSTEPEGIAWHFPDERLFVSYGAISSEDAALALQEAALRIAGHIARDEGWLAERMMLVELEDPKIGRAHV